MPDNDKPDDPKLRAMYDQLCESYRAIDDFRTKLLGFLPFVTGGGLILLTGRQEAFAREFFLPVGLFGLVVTAALFSYEIFGIRKCHDLIILGKQLEGKLKYRGQFTVRRKLVGRVINEPFAAGIIYPAAMAAWIYLALFYTARPLGALSSIAIFLLGFTLTFRYDLRLGHYPNEPAEWWGQSSPSKQGLVVVFPKRTPPSWVMPAESGWVAAEKQRVVPAKVRRAVPAKDNPPRDARLRPDLAPLWVWALYKLGFIDPCNPPTRIWRYAPWETQPWDILQPETPAEHAESTGAASG